MTLLALLSPVPLPVVRLRLLVTCGVLVVAASCRPDSMAPETSRQTGTGAVASVQITPSTANLTVGQSTTLHAVVRDANGRTLTGRVVTWSSHGSAARVDPAGRVTAASPGDGTITATSEGQDGSASIHVIDLPRPVTTHVLVGAGDIASSVTIAEATARLLDNIPGTVIAVGDNAYPDGTASDYATRYAPTWGRHKARTRPCPGNHEYHTPGAPDYFAYFGDNAGPAGRGYYSFDLGDWHIISLNSNIDMKAGSVQERWLRADLAASNKECTLAFWHHPRFSSGTHGSSTSPSPLWQALQDAWAEIVIVGHDHNYQRFAPQTAAGVADSLRGIREFVVGTGGAGLYHFTTPIANTQAYSTAAHGVLKLTLGPGTYAWEFIPVAGDTYHDSGTGVCHR
jgi:hypothetical protein